SPSPSQQLAATPDLSQAATITAQSTGGSETPSYSSPAAPVTLATPFKRSYRTIEEEASAPAGPPKVPKSMCPPPGMRAECPWLDRSLRSLPRTLSQTSPPRISWPIARGTESLWTPSLPNRGATWDRTPRQRQVLARSRSNRYCKSIGSHSWHPRSRWSRKTLASLQLAPRHASGAPLT